MLVPSHSYLILDQLELESGVRLLLVRNPWGREEYNGAWGDDDRRWTSNNKRQREIPENNDGLFYISVEDYLEHMDLTFINYDTSDWFHAYFMMWDDPEENKGDSFDPSVWCKTDCIQHTLFVKSSIKQAVRIGGHAYRFYTYADAKGQCPVRRNDPQLTDIDFDNSMLVLEENFTKHVISETKTGHERAFTSGAGWLPSLDLEAGEEIEIRMELNFERRGITKDWSVTAWGTKGPVQVRHASGIESRHFSYTPNGEMKMDFEQWE